MIECVDENVKNNLDEEEDIGVCTCVWTNNGNVRERKKEKEKGKEEANEKMTRGEDWKKKGERFFGGRGRVRYLVEKDSDIYQLCVRTYIIMSRLSFLPRVKYHFYCIILVVFVSI